MHASVIVPARDAQATLPRTLAALARQEIDCEYEVIVIDDGSCDRTAQLALEAPGPVTVVAQPPSGPAAARNAGVARSRGEALVFCDADTFPMPRWLRSGLEALAGADIVQGKVLPDPMATLGPFDRTIWITSEAGLWESANLFVSRELFDRIGGFEEWIRPRNGKALAEDVWFGYRAQRLGARAAFCEDALAYHAVFRRDWRGYVAERRRLQYFPAIVRKAPELRRTFLYRRAFLNERTARLDLAFAGALLAAVGRSLWPLVAGAPYLRALLADSRRGGPGGPSSPVVAIADLSADLVGLMAMLQGSVRYRSFLL